MAKVWIFGDDVDTDQIIASQYIILPNIDEMKAYAFESLESDFAKRVQPGDILLAGENFGCGSSREQAPAVLKALGVAAVVAKSFARIFYRNAINIGLPVAVSESLPASPGAGEAEIDLKEGVLKVGGESYRTTRLPQHMQAILDAGGLLESLNAEDSAR